jgi:hypothetical protein
MQKKATSTFCELAAPRWRSLGPRQGDSVVRSPLYQGRCDSTWNLWRMPCSRPVRRARRLLIPRDLPVGSTALTREAAFRWVAAGGFLVLIVLIRVAGQCIREWLRLRMVRALVMGGVRDRIKVVGGSHGSFIEIRPDDPARWPGHPVDLHDLDRSSDQASTAAVASQAPQEPRQTKNLAT